MIAWFARNPIAANLLMLSIIGAGLASLTTLRQITYPDVAFEMIDVTVEYPGAAPDEVEQSVSVRIEEAIHGVDGIDRLMSRSVEGRGNVTATLETGADAQRVLEQIRTRVAALRTLPDGASAPVVEELVDNSVLLSLVIAGNVGERALREIGERVRDELARLPEVALVDLASVRPYEISIEVSETALRRHQLTFDDVANAVRAASIDLPAGSLKTRAGEILLRTQSEARRGAELERLPLLTRPDGTRLRIGEVARVVDEFSDVDERASLDGEPAVVVRVMTRNDRHVLSSSTAVHAYLERAQSTLPAGVRMLIWDDESEELRSRRSLLIENGLEGLVLVVAVLGLFLGFRLAFWVTAGIPMAFLGALFVMGILDVSINMLTLFAFIVALGLVVDDAIVIGESIAAEQDRERDPLAAAIRGVRRVALPVTVSVITTILFVSPQLVVPGFFGKMVKGIAIVLICCLVFSLVESLLVLPAHLVRGGRSGERGPGGSLFRTALRPFEQLHLWVDARLRWFVRDRYTPLLRRVLARPGLTLSIASVFVMLSVSLLVGGWVPVEFTPRIEGETVTAALELEKGTPAAVTWATLQRIEREARELAGEIDSELTTASGAAPSILQHIVTSLGSDPDHHDDFNRGAPGGHVGRVRLQLAPSAERSVSSFEIAERWRARVGDAAGAVALSFSGEGLMDDPDVQFELTGADPAALESAAEALRAYLVTLPGVREVGDSHRAGKRELELSVRPEAEALGLTQRELARQVRQGFHGELVQSIQRGRDEVAVVVRYPREQRRSLGDLESIRIRTPRGGEVPFAQVARVSPGRGTATIRRADRRRAIDVSASVDANVVSASEVIDTTLAALPSLLAPYPGISVQRSGMSREADDVFVNRNRNLAIALLIAYALMAVTLRSYSDPLLVMVAIPFGIGGAIAAHALLGFVVSGFSMIGMVALTGVVVNDSLVLIHTANGRRAAGTSSRTAMCEAAAERFRPILLTSLTTFFGLLPLLFESSSQAAWLKPIGVTLAFGVMFATGVTLLVVPAASALLEDLRSAIASPGRQTASAPEKAVRDAASETRPAFG